MFGVKGVNNLELLKCIKSVMNHNWRLNNLFTKDVEYEFVPVSNRYTKTHNLIGYVKKDGEGFKRWITEDFKQEHFK
jgi:hypothetical protein